MLWQLLTISIRAIQKFQTYISIFIDMCNSRSYNIFQWFYPGIFQPLQPASSLLVDLLRNPESKEAAESRRLMEVLFSLIGPEGRLTRVHNGNFSSLRRPSYRVKQAWLHFNELRRAVWKELRFDDMAAMSLPSPPVLTADADYGLLHTELGTRNSEVVMSF
jgi:hypothetical protein